MTTEEALIPTPPIDLIKLLSPAEKRQAIFSFLERLLDALEVGMMKKKALLLTLASMIGESDPNDLLDKLMPLLAATYHECKSIRES
jgi:hypothetical protein